jgi:hydroxypyruvate isomerase
MLAISRAVAWWCFVPDKLSPEQFVRAAAKAGYAALDLVLQAYWPLVTAHGLALSAIEGHASISHGLNRRDQHDRIEQDIRVRLALAERWKIPNLICFSGNRDGQANAPGVEITDEGLRRVASAAEDAGVNLVLELLNSKVDHPDYQADHTHWGMQVCRQVASSRVKLLYDVYHMQIMEGDIIWTIQAIHPMIAHYPPGGITWMKRKRLIPQPFSGPLLRQTSPAIAHMNLCRRGTQFWLCRRPARTVKLFVSTCCSTPCFIKFSRHTRSAASLLRCAPPTQRTHHGCGRGKGFRAAAMEANTASESR